LIVIEPPSSGTDSAGDFSSLRRPVLSRFLARARKAAGIDGDVTVLLADDTRLKQLNRAFRGKNKPTDVLSFPAAENGEGVAGDLAISVETASRQAAEHGHSLEDELRVLILHGMLHLAGYDHEADSGEMREFEAELRARLKLPVGLIERAQTAKVSARKAGLRKQAPSKGASRSATPRRAR
jgi:probable rRNA maturation factor